jgi:hypothetical protein
LPLRETLSELHEAAQQRPNPDAIVTRWQKAVSDLYAIIERNLADYTAEGLLILQQREVSRSEEGLGVYAINELHIIAGTETIILTPIGVTVIGAHGRVDMFKRGYVNTRCILLWTGKATNAAGWQIISPFVNDPPKIRLYSKSFFEATIDQLLKQGS